MKNWYNDLEARFSTFTGDVQILHMVSDLTKADNLKSVNINSSKNHLLRALILLNYIINNPKWQPKLRELLRLREAIGPLIVDNPLGSTSQIISAALQIDFKAYRAYHSI